MHELPGLVIRSGRSGWYLRVLEPGLIEKRMEVTLVERPNPEWSVARASQILHHRTPDLALTLQLAGPLREYGAGASQLSLSARTVRAALEDLERSQSALYRHVCDETGAVRRHLNVFVNACHVRDLDGIDTTLTPGDVVTILPAVSGG